MTLKLPKSALEFVLYQRTDLLPERNVSSFRRLLIRLGLMSDGYKNFVKSVAADDKNGIDEKYSQTMKEKVDSIAKFIPSNTSSVLDIGCGIAALDIYLDKLLSPSQIFLLDKTETEDKIWYMFESKGAFYNSLELAKETLELNGVLASKVKLIEAPEDGRIALPDKSVDLIISTISWGFHYPINIYIQSVFDIISDNGVLIIDVRKGSGGIAELEEWFDVMVINEIGNVQTVKCLKKI